MIFLAIAWFGLAVFIILWLVFYYSKDKELKDSLKSVQILLIILMTLYAIVGIATKDPLTEVLCTAFNFCVPATLEWVAYIAVLGLLIWKFILVDMKSDISSLKHKVSDIERETYYIKATLEGVKNNTNLLLNKARINF